MTTLSLPSLIDSRDRAAARPRNVALWALVAMVASAAVIGRGCYLFRVFDHDARLFVYLGKLVCDGGRFGHDLTDNKFPSVGMMTSVFWRLLGTWWPGYVLVQMGMVVGGALMLGRAARRSFGEHARLAAVMFALVYLNFNHAVFGGFQLETMLAFFSIVAACAVMEALRGGDPRDAFVAGMAAGCGMMLKPTGGSVLAAFALATFVAWPRRPGKIVVHGVCAAAGLALPMLVVVVYLVRTDVLRDMPELYRQIRQYAAATPTELSDWMKPIVVCAVLGFPIVVRGWVMRRERITEGGITGRNVGATGGANVALVMFAAAWFALELIGAMMQKRMYTYHFLPVVPPAALLYAMLPRRENAVAMLAALAPAVLLSILGAKQVMAAYYPPVWRLAASDYLVAHTQPGDRVWADSCGRLLLETNLEPGARIPLTFLFFNHDTAPLEYGQIILNDFAHRQPKYIVLPSDLAAFVEFETTRNPAARRPERKKNYVAAWASIKEYVEQNYRAETVIDGDTLWRRRD